MITTVGLGETVNYKFTTSVNGVPTQLAGSPAVACYVGSSTTERTTGVTLTVDFDARTGLNNVAIVATSGNGYAAGERITLVLTAGTVGGYSVVGTVVGAFCVVPAMVYDALVDGTDTLQADVTQWLGTAAATPSVAGVPEVDLTHIAGSAVNTSSAQLGVNVVQAAGTAWGSGAITAGAIASNAITSAKIAANAIGASQIAAGAIDAATFAADVDAEILSYLVDDATKIDASALNTATGTTIPAILTDTAEIGAAGAGLTEAGGTGDHLTAVPWNAAWDAEVQSEAEDALVAHRLDELMNADSDIDGAAPPTVGSVVHELLSKTAGSFTFDQTTDSLEALRDRGDAAWLTATGFSTLDAAGVRTAVGLAAANLDTQLAALPTTAENAAAVWDEARSGHISAGTFGEGVASVQGNVTGSVASVTGAVGSVTGNVGGNVSGSVGSVATGGIAAGSIADGALTAAKFASGAFDAVWSVSTRTLTSISGLGIALATKLTKYVQLLARKDSAIATDNATELTEINADGGSGAGAFANTTDAVEALRDNQQTAAAAALTAYDPPTNAEMEARTLAAAAYATAAAQATAQADLDVLAGSDGVTLATSQPHYAPATAASATAIETDTQDIQSRLPAALVGGRIDATVDAAGMESGAIDAILDDAIGDGTITLRQALRVLIAGMAGKISGAATTTVTIRNLADTADVVVATVDADGNRTAVTVTP